MMERAGDFWQALVYSDPPLGTYSDTLSHTFVLHV